MITTTYVDAKLHHDQVTGKDAYTLSMQHHPTGTPRDKLQLRLQPMDLSLWQQELLQIKS